MRRLDGGKRSGHARTSNRKFIQLPVGDTEGPRFEPTAPEGCVRAACSAMLPLEAVFEKEQLGTAGENVTATKHGFESRSGHQSSRPTLTLS
jgi:hypothetical protein